MTSADHQQSMFSPEASPAKTTQLQETAAAWLATVARSGGNSTASLMRDAPLGLSGRMCLDSSAAETVKTSQASLIRSSNSGMAWSGACLMLSGSEWRNAAAVCSLSDILEDSPDRKYSLSAKACSGILSRAEKRGRSLPRLLRVALEQVADQTTTQRKETT